MSYEKKEKIIALLLFLVFLGAIAAHYLLSPWGTYRAMGPEETALRQSLVTAAESRLGINEADGSHKQIVEIYNSQEVLPVGYVLQDTDSWCAAFVTAMAMETGLTEIIPPECGCERQIGLWQELGRWQEWDDYVPQPGDIIYYDWNMEETGECTGWSDHVGIVVGVKWPFLKVIEGNYNDQVGCRVIPVGEITVRGYGLPEY